MDRKLLWIPAGSINHQGKKSNTTVGGLSYNTRFTATCCQRLNPDLFKKVFKQKVIFCCVFFLSKHSEIWHLTVITTASQTQPVFNVMSTLTSQLVFLLHWSQCQSRNLSLDRFTYLRHLRNFHTHTVLLPQAILSTEYIIHLQPNIAVYSTHVKYLNKDGKEMLSKRWHNGKLERGHRVTWEVRHDRDQGLSVVFSVNAKMFFFFSFFSQTELFSTIYSPVQSGVNFGDTASQSRVNLSRKTSEQLTKHRKIPSLMHLHKPLICKWKPKWKRQWIQNVH